MNSARQILRRFGRTTGAQSRSAADYSIAATISVVPDPFNPNDGALTAADQTTARARDVGDMRNRLAILCHLGNDGVAGMVIERVKNDFLCSLQRLCAIMNQSVPCMDYIRSLSPEFFTETALATAREKERIFAGRWRLKRSLAYYFLQMIGIYLQGAYYRWRHVIGLK